MIALPLASTREVRTTPEIGALIESNAPIAVGVSGGKDSSACAMATAEHLDMVGHTGPRVLVHADLGVTEWADSLPTCERLAKRLGWELVVVRRPQGDMMDRWEQRWNDNVARWESLSCVKLILPWSTPSMRFCTAELKVDQICRELCKRYPGQTIVNATGIRWAESTERAKAPIAKPQPKLSKDRLQTKGVDWHPIIHWELDDVLDYHREQDFPLHEAYTLFGSSRVSCVWCILATEADHRAATLDPRNAALARRMVALEATSTYAFQGSRWLSDTLGNFVPGGRTAVQDAKNRAALRESAESKIPKHLLYTKGWPTCVPTFEEACLLTAVRWQVAEAVGLEKTFCKPVEIVDRYEELISKKQSRDVARSGN